MASEARTHYQVLGVPSAASPGKLRDAYLNLARLLHPDKHQDAGPAERRLAERRMREVNAAWAVLREPTTRATYDQSLRIEPSRPKPGPQATPRSKPAATNRGTRIVSADELDQLDPDEVAVTRLTYHLITKGPFLIIGALALMIFVFSAYAKEPVADPTTPNTVTTVTTSAVRPEPGG